MTTPTFTSTLTVELIDSMGGDARVAQAARVSTIAELSLAEHEGDNTGLIGYLMRDRHGSPFEHVTFSFYVHAPIFVFREFMRHRIASYNEESGRYTTLKPVFYWPGPERKLRQVGKPGAYEFVDGFSPVADAQGVEDAIYDSCTDAYAAYERMLERGIAKEVARMVLPVNIFSSMYVTMNARSLMNFLSLRTKSEDSTYPSFPQREIEMVAEQMEVHFQELLPITHAAFVKRGRVSP